MDIPTLFNDSPVKAHRVVSGLGNYKQSCCKHACTGLYADITFYLSYLFILEPKTGDYLIEPIGHMPSSEPVTGGRVGDGNMCWLA